MKPLSMPDSQDRAATAKAQAEAYVREQRALAKDQHFVKLRRVVKGACASAEPHYLVYLTKEEIAHVLAVTAEKPTGHMHPQKVLCAPPTPPTSPRHTERINTTNIESFHPEHRLAGGRQMPAVVDVDPEVSKRVQWNIRRLLALHNEKQKSLNHPLIEGADWDDLVRSHTRNAYQYPNGIDAYFANQFAYIEGWLAAQEASVWW